MSRHALAFKLQAARLSDPPTSAKSTAYKVPFRLVFNHLRTLAALWSAITPFPSIASTLFSIQQGGGVPSYLVSRHSPPAVHPTPVPFVFMHLRTYQFARYLFSNLYNSGVGVGVPPIFLSNLWVGFRISNFDFRVSFYFLPSAAVAGFLLCPFPLTLQGPKPLT